ncbi:hypothetical protein J5X98_25980 [Leptothermofonsia sichuanensis E412]|uniref:hypothetical protein n=1 Tax=Leptothermofonsia sichuanensis TaxID=2917832 RepID=UPI001CA713F0|nr:hypothetical protein [Leptothermofonsia sichuanensis]QZZ20637.1 hypothetical protein J5X98_25980 [Leptothermofonsia sichuanensis E412]
MLNIKMLLTLVSISLFLSIPPKVAQSQDEICKGAIKVATSRSKHVYYVRYFRLSDLRKYRNIPPGRPFMISFILRAGDGSSVMRSSSLLEETAKDLIRRCGSVSLINYQVSGTSDGAVSYGLVEGTTRKLQCIEAGRNAPDVIPWGYDFCF